ncbi:glycoside hydrolase superfamily [Pyronema omphalodes]|nr:glycoside hydrolase superfamily [Pyronema omphalodes]
MPSPSFSQRASATESSESGISSNVTFDTVKPHPTLNTFADSHGRCLLLRGLNVAGDSKHPNNNPLAGTPEFYDVSKTSYTGRPFKNQAEAASWWNKLRSWGVGVARLVVVWEALEPREMGVYDEEYLEYIHMIVKEAEKAGVRLFVDGHQDCWSRFSGGSGAPIWTFHLAGLDPRKFPSVCAVALDEPDTSCNLSTPSGRLWPTNYSKYAVATMFTLFFAGEVFAPKAVYTGPEQEYHGKNIGYVLRTAYTRAFSRLLCKLKDCTNVLGVDPMNEPHPGYIGLPSLHYFNETTDLHLGHMPNAIESMALAAGVPTRVGYYTRSWPHPSKVTRRDVLNEDRIGAYLPNGTDVWQAERVFTISPTGDSVELGPKGDSYFFRHPITGAEVDFERDFYVPFIRSFHRDILAAVSDGKMGSWLFVEPVPNVNAPEWHSATSPEDDAVCFSPHWYDIRALYEKKLSYTTSFDVLSLARGSRNFLAHTYFGKAGLTNNYAKNFQRFWHQLEKFRANTTASTPILIGETGVPWDINHQSAYVTGNIHHHIIMMDAILHGMEMAGPMNWTFWNITLNHNTSGRPRLMHNETAASFQSGDGWNSEDFSIVSSDPATTEIPLNPYIDRGVRPHDNGRPLRRAAMFGDLYRGLRAAPAFLRPYPIATAGRILKSEFLLSCTRFVLEYAPNTSASSEIARTTECFIPAYHFWGRKVVARFWIKDKNGVRSEEVALKWDFMEGEAAAGLKYRWVCARQALEVTHREGLEGEVGVTLEALGEIQEDGWWEKVRSALV